MKAVSMILDVLCTMNEVFWMFYLANHLLQRRKFAGNRGLFICGIIGYVSLVISLNQIVLTSPYTTIIAILYMIICMSLLWKSDLLNSIAIVGAYFTAMFLVAILEMSITGWIGGDKLIEITTQRQGIHRCVYLVICGTIWLIINFFVNKKLGEKIRKTDIKYIAIVSGIGIIGSVFVVKQILDSFNIATNFVTYLFLITLTAAVFLLYFRFKYLELEQERQLMNERSRLMEEKYNQLSRFYTSNAKLYHDMDNHLRAIYHMADQGNLNEVTGYIKEMNAVQSEGKITVWTGIDIIDAILTEAERLAREQKICIEITAHMIPTGIHLEKWELCSLFSNLLNNCMEAKPTRIEVFIKVVGRMLLIQTKNDYAIAPVAVDGHYVTQKKDSGHHGWGLRSVRDIAEKHGGSVEFINENETFCVNVLVNLD